MIIVARMAFFTLLAAFAVAGPSLAQEARHSSFNDGWRFFQGEVVGAEAPEFNDDQWRDVRLPHDWAIEGPFDPALNPHTGYNEAAAVATQVAVKDLLRTVFKLN